MHRAEKQLRFVKIVVLLYFVFTEYISETSRFVKFFVKKHYTLTYMKKSLRFVKIAVLLYSIFIKKRSVITRFILFYGQIPTSKHDFYFIKRSLEKVSIYYRRFTRISA